MCTVATPAACLIRAYAQAARTAAPKTVAASQPARDSLAKSARFSLGKRSAAIQEQMHLDAVLPALGQGNVVCPISGLGPLNLVRVCASVHVSTPSTTKRELKT